MDSEKKKDEKKEDKNKTDELLAQHSKKSYLLRKKRGILRSKMIN